MYEESKEMKMIRDIRIKHYEEIKGMKTEDLLKFYKQKAEKMEDNKKESRPINHVKAKHKS